MRHRIAACRQPCRAKRRRDRYVRIKSFLNLGPRIGTQTAAVITFVPLS
jgi:hypothetical protein